VRRRDVHKILLWAGALIATAALADVRLDWWQRSDMWWGGLLVMALGVHGIWKVSA
jgi:hypothetical protein